MIVGTIPVEPASSLLPETWEPARVFFFLFSVISPSLCHYLPQFPKLLLSTIQEREKAMKSPATPAPPHSLAERPGHPRLLHSTFASSWSFVWSSWHLLFQATGVSFLPTAADVPSGQHRKRGDISAFIFLKIVCV